MKIDNNTMSRHHLVNLPFINNVNINKLYCSNMLFITYHLERNNEATPLKYEKKGSGCLMCKTDEKIDESFVHFI